ncbi:MAG TPA: hypothetical protein PL033_04335 [Candidatus Brocadiia bacterium]|nr:hypothetical protein [Candidatus Brocadiia bacterium]
MFRPAKEKEEFKVHGVLGVGLDGKDGHERVTTAPNFLLMGGSQETHGHMQESALQFNEKLAKRGKKITDLEKNEFLDLAGESGLIK